MSDQQQKYSNYDGDDEKAGSDSDEEEDVEISSADCLKRCQEFAQVTNTDTALAMFYLQDVKWDLEV